MAQPDIFKKMGNVYRLLIDEKARALREGPMLLAVAEMARMASGVCPAGARVKDAVVRGGRLRPRAATRVLDLACGTGIHARLLGRAGYAVTALDASATMLEEARRFANPASVQYALADLREPLLGPGRAVARPAALALLLGNTLSVFESDAEVGAVLANVAAALLPPKPARNAGEAGGGMLLVQTLNYARLRRAGGSAVVRCGRLRGRETVVTKSLQPLDDGRHVLLTLTAAQGPSTGQGRFPAGTQGDAKKQEKRHAGGRHEALAGQVVQGAEALREKEGWNTAAESTLLRAWAPEEIVAAARTAGLELREAWGGPGREAFDEEKSTDFVGLFEVAGR